MTAGNLPPLLRLFSDLCPPTAPEDREVSQVLDLERFAPFIIGRLLEDGDSQDLSWLADRLGEARWVEWLEVRGGRQLSRRSLAFWSLVLDSAVAPSSSGELWPL